MDCSLIEEKHAEILSCLFLSDLIMVTPNKMLYHDSSQLIEAPGVPWPWWLRDLRALAYYNQHENYSNYEARVVTVCAAWRSDFLIFYKLPLYPLPTVQIPMPCTFCTCKLHSQ